jgi:transcription termination factor Rho
MTEDTLSSSKPARKAAKRAAKAPAPAAKKAAAKRGRPKMATDEPELIVADNAVVEAAPAYEPAVESPRPAKPVRKASKKVAKPKSADLLPAETAAVMPPPIPEPPPIPDVFPVVDEAPTARPPRPSLGPGANPGANGAESNDPNKGRLSRRQRWKEKLRQKYLARIAARSEVTGSDGLESEPGDGQKGERPPPEPLGPPEAVEGVLEFTPKGYGFLRLREKQYAALPSDCWVSGDLIRKYGLREGMCIRGEQRLGTRGPQLMEIADVNGRKPDELRDLPLFEELKATNPAKRYQLETRQDRMTTRVIDMMTPVGRGQRGLIVAPPRAGKTTLLQHIAEAITQNYPQVHLMLLLVDERPEEVTEFRRILGNAEIYASSNDQDVKSHTRIAQLAIERAKRLVEMGDHVFILMDSITRLARAFNNAQKGGATMSGGMGVGAMEIPRRLFAAARNTKTAGSLTILATALVETGSKMDDLIFQEFKGTGNMELVLDRKIAEQYIYPAVNIFKSGTRREELLLQSFQIEKIHFLRRGLAGHKPVEAIQRVLSLLEKYPTNSQMLVELTGR